MPLWALRLSSSWYVHLSWEGCGQGSTPPCPPAPTRGSPARRAPGDPVSSPPPTLLGPQVNMLIGIIVFNKLMARDGISDKSKKQRAG